MANKADMEEFCAYLREQANNGSIYLWGGQGEPLDELTDEYIMQRETSKNNARRVMRLRDRRVRAGYGATLRAYDCSGLGVHFLRDEKKVIPLDMTADGLFRSCRILPKSGAAKGDWVFRVKSGKAYHIGYIVDDAFNVAESAGRDSGVVVRSMDAPGRTYWNAFGRPSVISGIRKAKAAEKAVFERELRRGDTGADVEALQRLLKGAGFSPGSIDGQFGKNTRAALRLFQRANALRADGVAGELTVPALGGVWKK